MSQCDKTLKYKEFIKGQQDFAGFIHADHCDSLLFSALIGCVPGVKVHIDAAMGLPGQWFRRPVYDLLGERWAYPECYSCGRSKSTISRDMLLGLAWFAWCNKRLDISEGVIRYAFRHGLVMGKGFVSRTFMTPSLLATFAWVSYRLGGPSRSWLRWIPADSGAKVRDYQAHLQCLHILLRKHLTGEWSKRDAKTARRLYEENKRNALFAAAAGLKDEARKLLDREDWWPSHRLPTSADRKAQWLVMRDYGSDWQPSAPETTTHSGGDYLFVDFIAEL